MAINPFLADFCLLHSVTVSFFISFPNPFSISKCVSIILVSYATLASVATLPWLNWARIIRCKQHEKSAYLFQAQNLTNENSTIYHEVLIKWPCHFLIGIIFVLTVYYKIKAFNVEALLVFKLLEEPRGLFPPPGPGAPYGSVDDDS